MGQKNKVVFFIPEKRRKILFCGGEGKRGTYLEMGNFLFLKRLKTKKEKEENIWRKRRRIEKETEGKCKRSSWTQNVS